MKHLKFLTILVMVWGGLQAQNETDALRYANIMPIGTAKFTGFGGAIGASGADLTSMSFNPAGTGIYRHSEVNLSMAWTASNAKSVYYNRQSETDDLQVHMGNIGFVVTNPVLNNSGWKYVNFGFGYNQLANYNTQMIIEGRNTEGSYLVPETDFVNSISNADAQENLFVKSNVIFYKGNGYTNDYYDNPDIGFNGWQDYKQQSSGNLGEYAFNLAANYADWLFLGATIGLQHINYEEQSVYTEDPTDELPGIQSFEYTENYRTKGTGFNLKLGTILKPFHFLRFGFAFHSPTAFNLTDNYYNSIKATINYETDNNETEIVDYHELSPDTYFDWSYNSPMKLLGSGSIVIGSFLMLNMDYEWVNYNNMNLSADNEFFEVQNENIKSNYKPTGNLKIGSEVRMGIISLRGGIGYYGSPYETGTSNEDAYKIAYSGGVGVKSKHVYFDAAYRYVTSESDYFIYGTTDSKADITETNQMFIATLGYRF